MKYIDTLTDLEERLKTTTNQLDLDTIKSEVLNMEMPDVPAEEQVTLLDMKYSLLRKMNKTTF